MYVEVVWYVKSFYICMLHGADKIFLYNDAQFIISGRFLSLNLILNFYNLSQYGLKS